ncbi:hypothetical protein CsatB_015740 [Cannabis sativa]
MTCQSNNLHYLHHHQNDLEDHLETHLQHMNWSMEVPTSHCYVCTPKHQNFVVECRWGFFLTICYSTNPTKTEKIYLPSLLELHQRACCGINLKSLTSSSSQSP